MNAKLRRYYRILEAEYADMQRGTIDEEEYRRRARLIDAAIDEMEWIRTSEAPAWRREGALLSVKRKTLSGSFCRIEASA